MNTKLPPQAPDLEAAVLGALMLEKGRFWDINPPLRPEHFYKPEHAIIYRAIEALENSQQPVDILTVTQQLRQFGQLNDVGGAFYITDLTSRVASAAHLEYHAKIVQQKAIQREIIRLCHATESRAYDDTVDIFEEYDRHLAAMERVMDGLSEGSVESFASLVNKAVQGAEAAHASESGITGQSWGIKQLDALTTGLHNGELVIIGGRPAMGKSDFAVHIARTVADAGAYVRIYSLEMQDQEFTNRIASQVGGINKTFWRTGQGESFERAGQVASELIQRYATGQHERITIMDEAAITVEFMMRDAKQWARKLGDANKVVILDYLQLMGTVERTGSRENEVSTVSRKLKQLAKMLDCPLVALAQLSRRVEERGGDKRPHLADLRESGSIEQDADMVGFLYRPEYYGMLTDEDGNSTRGLSELIVAKNRNGAIGTAKMHWTGSTGVFTDWAQTPTQYNQPSFSSQPTTPF